MGDSEEGLLASGSNEKGDSQNEVLYRKLEILKSKLDIDFSIPKNDEFDFVFIAVHGMGTTDAMLENDYKSLKHTLEVVRKHWFYNQKLKIHLRFINWKKYIVDAQNTLFDNVCIDTMKGMRRAFILAMLDVTFYFNPKFSDYLASNVANDINSEITRLRNHPSNLFKNSKIVIIGYSMGSVIVDDLIRINEDRISNVELEKRPRLEHKIDYFFAIGSPLSCSLVYHTPQIIKTGLQLPENIEYYNVFHPYDPIACRWEKLIYRDMVEVPKPVVVPYWYNNGFKNWYNIDQQLQYCKSLIVDNLSDVANSISKSFSNWLGTNQNDSVLNQNTKTNMNRKKSFNDFRNLLKRKDENDNTEGTLGTIMDENQKTDEQEDTAEEQMSDFEMDNSSSNALEKLNLNPSLPRRYDYQLQEDATEHFLNPLAILQSHISYWGSRDVAFFMLKTIHNRKEKVPITSLLTYVESKAKSLVMATEDEELKKEFGAISERAKKMLEELSKEDIKFKNESVIALKSTWNLMTKTKDDDEKAFESSICDNIEQEEGNVQT